MSPAVRSKRWVMGGGLAVLLVVLMPLWKEFNEPGQMVWNISLGVFLAGLAISAFVLQGYLTAHIGEVGEARFNADGSKKIDG